MKFSPIQVCRVAFIPYFKINAPIFCCSIFFEECFNPQVRINKMVNEYTVDYHPSPSELTLRIHPLIFLWTRKGFISPEFFLNFFPNLNISRWLQKGFKFMMLRLLENTFLSQKLNLFMPPSKTLFQVFIITTPGRRKLPISPEQRFLEISFPH